MTPLIQLDNLFKIYEDGTVGLDEVSLTINEGEFVAIMGPSGSGKSTLLQILGCLDRPTSGTYSLLGRNIQEYNDTELAQVRNRTMGFVFQAFNLLPRLSVLENVKLPLLYADVPEPLRTQKAKDVIDVVGLGDRAHFNATKISGGQKQRAAIARALVNSPKVIFADEPTGNLDSKSGASILTFFEELHHKGHTIILVTHETYVANLAHRILHIHDGKISLDEKVANRSTIHKDSQIK